MSWFALSANEVEAGKEHVALFVAVDFDFPSGHSRVWSGMGDLTFGGNTYSGLGQLGKIEVPTEGVGLDAQTKKYQCSGVDPALMLESDIDYSYGRSVTEYFGFFDTETGKLVAVPEINWEGRIDSIRRVDGKEPIIEVSAEHRMVLLQRNDLWRYTQEHQDQFYPGDNGFDQVTVIQLKKVIWSGKNTDPGTIAPYMPYRGFGK